MRGRELGRRVEHGVRMSELVERRERVI